jgi:hypothetical protein
MTVPISPTAVGIAAVVVMGPTAPLVGLSWVMVVNCRGTWTMTVPTWSAKVGIAPVDVVGAVKPLAVFSWVIVVN